MVTESDRIHYQSRAKSNDWNRNILIRDGQREMWMSILESCLFPDTTGRAKNIDEILNKFPEDDFPYVCMTDSKVEAPREILNGVMLHVMQGSEFDKYYRLPEIMQHPKRIITVGRADNSVFNMIPLLESATAYISRHHCTLEFDDEKDEWYVRDGQWDMEKEGRWSRSLNGTYVNSEKVTEEGYRIAPGDIISIGDIKLRVEAY